MRPKDFPEKTKVLSKPSNMTDKECSPLSVFNDGKVCISCWTGTLKERIKFLFKGCLWLYVHSGVTQPPVALIVDYPFKKV